MFSSVGSTGSVFVEQLIDKDSIEEVMNQIKGLNLLFPLFHAFYLTNNALTDQTCNRGGGGGWTGSYLVVRQGSDDRGA